jgi:hypothetical protein
MSAAWPYFDNRAGVASAIFKNVFKAAVMPALLVAAI